MQVVWFELYAEDVARASRFYQRVFGWHTRSFTEYDPSGGYALLTYEAGGRSQGAIVRRPEADPGRPTGRGSVVYVEVPDLAAAVDAVREAGGHLVDDKRAIGGDDGYFSIVADTEGNLLGLWSDVP